MPFSHTRTPPGYICYIVWLSTLLFCQTLCVYNVTLLQFILAAAAKGCPANVFVLLGTPHVHIRTHTRTHAHTMDCNNKGIEDVRDNIETISDMDDAELTNASEASTLRVRFF